MKITLSALSAILLSSTTSLVQGCSITTKQFNIEDNKDSYAVYQEMNLLKSKQSIYQKQILIENKKIKQINHIIDNIKANYKRVNILIGKIKDQLTNKNKQNYEQQKTIKELNNKLKEAINDKNEYLNELDKLNKEIMTLKGNLAKNDELLAKANETIKKLQKKIDELENRLKNPITLGNLSISDNNDDYSEFDIELGKTPEIQGNIDTSIFYIEVSDKSVYVPRIKRITINKTILHIVLDEGFNKKYDYENELGYFIQIKLNNDISNIRKGSSSILNIPSIESANFMDSNIKMNDSKDVISLNLSNNNAIQGEIRQANEIFTIEYLGTAKNMSNIVKAIVNKNELLIYLDKPFPVSSDELYIWYISLEVPQYNGINGIQSGITKVFEQSTYNSNITNKNIR